MLEKLKEWRGGILLFLCLFSMINIYMNRITELRQYEENNRIAYYDSN